MNFPDKGLQKLGLQHCRHTDKQTDATELINRPHSGPAVPTAIEPHMHARTSTLPLLQSFSQRSRIARNASAVIVTVDLSVRPSVRPSRSNVFSRRMIVRSSASGRTIILVSGEAKFFRIYSVTLNDLERRNGHYFALFHRIR